MTARESGAELLDVVQGLRTVVRRLVQESARPPEARMPRLEVAIGSLGQAKLAKRVRCPEEYVQQWEELLHGPRERLEPRAVRYLCWEPDVATDSRFQNYLDREKVGLSPRSLQGLVRACHARWSSALATGQVATRVRDRLKRYDGPHRVLSRWKDAATTILGPRGSEEFAADMVENLWPIKEHCDVWGVEEHSPYVQEAIQTAARECRDRMERVLRLRQYLLANILPWSGWLRERFKAEVGDTILHPGAAQPSDIRESVKHFVLGEARLGDPRLPTNRDNWLGLAEAKSRVIEWLSRADIVFFFEHVLPQGRDRHGRKAFWLQYVPRVRMSRPLLNWDDGGRLRATLTQNREHIQFGTIDGNTSAFLLEFGPILIIEFSRVGNACYIYETRIIDQIIPDFWMSQSFGERTLKQRGLCGERIIHRRGWQEEMIAILARYGIRSS